MAGEADIDRRRLPVWEDAVDLGFVVRVHRDGAGTMVDVTAAGRAFLGAAGRRGTADFADFLRRPGKLRGYRCSVGGRA